VGSQQIAAATAAPCAKIARVNATCLKTNAGTKAMRSTTSRIDAQDDGAKIERCAGASQAIKDVDIVL